MDDLTRRAVESISDRDEMDWKALEAAATDAATQERLRALADVAAISRVHSTSVRRSLRPVPFTWGPLEVREWVARGAHGDVYRAWDPRLDRQVALKLVRHEDAGAISIAEGRLLARVHHPNVVAVHGADRIGDEAGVWMEFVHGRTLRQDVEALGPMDVHETVRIGSAVCSGLEAIHRAGLLHRDVKAQNVMRADDGRVVLMDLSAGRDAALPADGLHGTPLYLAPELLDGQQATIATDVYAVGVLLFFLLTGRYPVAADSVQELKHLHERRATERLASVPTVPSALSAVVDRALSLDPARRFSSIGDLREALQNIVAPSRTRAPVRVLALFLVVVTVAAVLYARAYHDRRAGEHAGVRATTAPAAGSRESVLIGAFDNRTGSPAFDGVVEAALERGLTETPSMAVVSQQRIDESLRLMTQPLDTPLQPDVAREVCLRDGNIRVFVGGRIDQIDGAYDIVASLFDPVDGRAVSRVEEHVSDERALPSAVGQLTRRVRMELGEAIGALHQQTDTIERVTTPSLRAAQLFSDGLRIFNLGRVADAEGRFKAALAADPGFASAEIWLAWTCMNLGRPGDECLASARRAMDLAPSVSQGEREWIAGSYYMLSGQDQAAIAQYEALLHRNPDDVWAASNLMRLYGSNNVRSLDFLAHLADAQPRSLAIQERSALLFLEFRGLDAARPYVDRLRKIAFDRNDMSNGNIVRVRIWTLIFTAHELWAKGRASDAARVLDAASQRPEFTVDRKSVSLLGKMRLALGQVRLAEEASNRIIDPQQRRIARAELALARDDYPGIASQLADFRSSDWAVASLLVRSGDLNAAERFRPTFPTVFPIQAIWAANEIQEARGNRDCITRALHDGVPWVNVMAGARTFMYSETLARAAAAIGQRAAAITVLERTEPAGVASLGQTSQAGFYWMRNQKLLADLYREDGQLDKARAVEQDLLARLAVADADYPLLVAVKQRVGK
jgi:serine/threonine-protein kinase